MSCLQKKRSNVVSLGGLISLLILIGIGINAWIESGMTQVYSDNYVEPGFDVIDLYMYIDEENLYELYNQSSSTTDRLYGEISFGNEKEVEPMAIRIRGNSTRALPKKSFNIVLRIL